MTSTAKKRRPELKVIEGGKSEPKAYVLSGLAEAELIEYVNFSDADAGLASALGRHLERMQEGTHNVRYQTDPESSMIRCLDRIARHRVIHRAMTSIGQHARVLTHAYLIALKPRYVDKTFGYWHSGIALAVADDVGALVQACRDRELGEPEQRAGARAVIHKVRCETIRLYNLAAKAYLEAIAKAKIELVKPLAPVKLETVPHVCRVSEVYRCPCGD